MCCVACHVVVFDLYNNTTSSCRRRCRCGPTGEAGEGRRAAEITTAIVCLHLEMYSLPFQRETADRHDKKTYENNQGPVGHYPVPFPGLSHIENIFLTVASPPPGGNISN